MRISQQKSPPGKNKMQYSSNGYIVRTSQPAAELRTSKKVITIDSRDRDPTKFLFGQGGLGVSSAPANYAPASDAGDYVVYLPRAYENVVSIRLRSAIIQAPSVDSGFTASDLYILLGLEGLNRMDETATGANRAGFIDSAFAKIPLYTNTGGAATTTTIFYNDASYEENITRYTPPVRLDRLHVTFRRHPASIANPGTVNPVTTNQNAPIRFGTAENSLTFEIEYLENAFNDFSSFQTRLDNVNYVR